MFSNSNYDGCIPTQFIVTTKSTEHLIKDCTSITDYYNKIKEMHSIDFDDLKSKIDQEFVAHILISKPFAEKGYTDQLDLGLDDALVYAYIFTHIDPEQHKQIRLFDWENIDKGQHGFLKKCLQSDKIEKTLNIKDVEEVYLPMIVHKKKTSKENVQSEYCHISFTTVKINTVGMHIIKSFDTLYGGSLNNENYILEQHGLKYTMLKSLKQGVSGCGFLTALNAVNYINNGTVDCPSIAGKSIKEIKEILTDSFGYKVDENAIDKDGSIESYPITIYYKNGIKAFEITKDIIEAIQQENKEGTQHGTPPIEHKTIAGSFPSFASIGTSSTSTGNLDYKQHQTLITPTPPQKDDIPSQSF